MQSNQTTLTDTSTRSELDGLFSHSTRPEWGLAIPISGGDRSMTFQFEDGGLRKIARSHRHMLVEVDRPRDESERVRRELARHAGLTISRDRLRAAGEEIIRLDEQIRLFLIDFEDGFDDAAYQKKHRGHGKRRTKRQRDPAIAHANALLGREEMLGLLSGYRHDLVIERVIEVLAATSMVTKKQLEPLKGLDERGQSRAAAALGDLLYGDVDPASAMQRWIDALASSRLNVSWSLATALPALVHPQHHMCIRRSAIAVQARWMAPRVTVGTKPNGKVYERLRSMAVSMVDELSEHDLTPRDLLDVYDFVGLTLLPAARKRIAALAPEPTESQVRTSAASSEEATADQEQEAA